MAAGAEQQQDQAPPSGPLARLSLMHSSAPPTAGGSGSGGGTSASSSSSLPSRTELLEIIRKHSWVLGQAAPSGGDQGGPEVPVDSWFWREVLDMFFVRGAADKKTPLDDDLLYFVRASADSADDLVMVDEHPQQQQYGEEQQQQDEEPYFVRRLGPSLDKLIGGSAWAVDWCRSVYLNLIQHTSYSLTVAICTREALQTHQQRRSPPSASPGRGRGPPLAPLYKVTKTVYASPARTAFQPDCTAKATATQAAYPDICFAVDDFANTFEAVVLTDSEQCFCVLLDACGGAAIDGRRRSGTAGSAVEMRSPNDDDEWQDAGPSSSSRSSPKVTLFSGFVSYSMVRSAFDNGNRSRFPGLHLGGAGGGGGSSSRPERLVMRGPGGRGEVDVAVSSVPAAAAAAAAAATGDEDSRNQQLLDPASDPPPPSPIKPGAKPGLGTIVWKAALAASTAARNAVIASSNGGKHDLSAPLPLRCCLMSLSLPWNSLAHDLLFK